jgi:hypothetical protein
MPLTERQERAAAADFNIVGMRTKTENSPGAFKAQMNHWMSTARRTTGESVQPHIGSEQGRRQHPAVIRAAFENDPCGTWGRARGCGQVAAGIRVTKVRCFGALS